MPDDGEDAPIAASNPIERERIVLAAASPGTERYVDVLRFGARDAMPKAYLQASLHADETPAMLVANHLAERLRLAAGNGDILGQVVLVPVANPIGLAQYVHGRAIGRFALGGEGNFNRHFPDLGEIFDASVRARLTGDAAADARTLRAAYAQALAALEPVGEVEALRHTLLGLAHDADIALDLHCDSEALMHLYLGTPAWPQAADLAAQLGAEATLLARDSGGDPFDESLVAPWWKLAEDHPELDIPSACLAGTVELRGRADVSESLAAADADNLYRFLQRRRVIDGEPGELPAPRCEATPLEGVDVVRSPTAGIVAYEKAPGERVREGEVLARVVDPLERGFAAARTELCSRCDGLLFTRTADRWVRPGTIVAKVAGSRALPDRHPGALLSD